MAVRIVSVLCAAVLLISCGAADDSADTVVVFAAASLGDAFTQLADDFEREHPDVAVSINAAGSSSLREQVLGGASADVVALANVDIMTSLSNAGEVVAPVVFAENEIRLGVPAGNPSAISEVGDLASDAGLFVGVCNGEVPCGIVARMLLDDLELAIEFDSEEPDARALATKVEAGEFDAAFLYLSDVVSNPGIDEVALPAGVQARTAYPIALTDSSHRGAADFAAFVRSAHGQDVLQAHGFIAAGTDS